MFRVQTFNQNPVLLLAVFSVWLCLPALYAVEGLGLQSSQERWGLLGSRGARQTFYCADDSSTSAMSGDIFPGQSKNLPDNDMELLPSSGLMAKVGSLLIKLGRPASAHEVPIGHCRNSQWIISLQYSRCGSSEAEPGDLLLYALWLISK